MQGALNESFILESLKRASLRRLTTVRPDNRHQLVGTRAASTARLVTAAVCQTDATSSALPHKRQRGEHAISGCPQQPRVEI